MRVEQQLLAEELVEERFQTWLQEQRLCESGAEGVAP